MEYSKTGEALTERFEDCKLQSYQDSVGVWTIGWGHTKDVKPNMYITQGLADLFLTEDTKSAVNCINQFVTLPINQEEFDALVDFVFNLGCTNFQRSTLLKLLNQGSFKVAALEFSKWDRAGGKVVAGLLRRRLAEQEEFNGKS